MDRGSLSRAFGYELEVRRKAAGLTAQQMWERLDWSKNTFRRTESGERSATLDDVVEIARVLDVSPTTLFMAAKKRWETGDYPTRTPNGEWRDILGL